MLATVWKVAASAYLVEWRHIKTADNSIPSWFDKLTTNEINPAPFVASLSKNSTKSFQIIRHVRLNQLIQHLVHFRATSNHIARG